MLAPLLVVAVLLGAWELYVDLGGIDSFILPAPSEIATAMWEDRALLADDLGVTAVEIGLGLVLAIVAGLGLALTMHLWPALRRAIEPLCVGTQAIPIPILAVVLITWFGFGLAPKLAVVALVCFFPVVVTTLDGLDRVDADQRKLLRTLGASRWQMLRFAEAPSALPAALSGARVAVAVGAIAAVFAEYTGSSAGLGHLIQQSIPQLETARAWAAVVLLAAFSVLCFLALGAAERRLAPWAHRKDHPTP